MATETIVYITYISAARLWVDGLKAVQVWFNEPVYIISSRKEMEAEIRNSPFPFDPREGFGEFKGWRTTDSSILNNKFFSFAKAFGYEGKEAEYIWKEISKHFKNEELYNWDELEKSNQVLPGNFILKMKLELKL